MRNLIPKITKAKIAGGMVQVVVCLLSKPEALRSTPNTNIRATTVGLDVVHTYKPST
jgi:hypothetical protein